jgi:hypothetical protein
MMMDFDSEYKTMVELESKYIADDIKEEASKNNYEADIFFEDVIKLARKYLNEKENKHD